MTLLGKGGWTRILTEVPPSLSSSGVLCLPPSLTQGLQEERLQQASGELQMHAATSLGQSPVCQWDSRGTSLRNEELDLVLPDNPGFYFQTTAKHGN